MRKTSFIVMTIFVLTCCNVLIYKAYAVCVDECKTNCNTIVDKKYSWGEGYLEALSGSKGGRDGLRELGETKRMERDKCYATCNDTCAQNAKEKKTEEVGEAKKE